MTGKSNTKLNHSYTIHYPHLSKGAIVEILSSLFTQCIYITQQFLLNVSNLSTPQIFTLVGTISLVVWPTGWLPLIPFCLWSSVESSFQVPSVQSVLTSGTGHHHLYSHYFLALSAFSDSYTMVLSGLNGSLAVSDQSCQLLFISSPPQFGSWEDVSTDVLERQKKTISY